MCSTPRMRSSSTTSPTPTPPRSDTWDSTSNCVRGRWTKKQRQHAEALLNDRLPDFLMDGKLVLRRINDDEPVIDAVTYTVVWPRLRAWSLAHHLRRDPHPAALLPRELHHPLRE